MLAHTINPSTWEVKIPVSLRTAWSTEQVAGQTGLCRKTCLENKTTTKNKTAELEQLMTWNIQIPTVNLMKFSFDLVFSKEDKYRQVDLSLG